MLSSFTSTLPGSSFPTPPATGVGDTSLVARDLVFRLFGWNLGGCAPDFIQDAVKMATGKPSHRHDVFALQECPRKPPGWRTDTTQDGSRLVSHRGKDQWRGVGIAFLPTEWSLLRRVAAGKGAWFLLKLLQGDLQLWIGTFHFTPGLTVQQHESEAHVFLSQRPKDGKPVLLQGDANAHLGWARVDAGVEPIGLEGKSIMLLDHIAAAGLSLTPPPASQFSTPTSRPRQEHREGRQIDLAGTKGILGSRLYIHEGSHRVCGADHELLELRVRVRVGKGFRRHCTKPRVWVGGPPVIDHGMGNRLR